MAIAFDTSAKTAYVDNVTSLTLSFTTTGSERALVVFVNTVDPTGDIISGVTYGGTAMTLIDKTVRYTGTNWTYLFYLLNPASGANDIVASFTESSAHAQIFASSYTGVNQTAIDAQNKNTGTGTTSVTVSITTVADNCWLVGGGAYESGISAGANTVIRQHESLGSGIIDSDGAKSPPGSYSLNLTQNSGNFGIVAVSLAPIIPSLIKKVAGVLQASIKKISPTAIAGVKKVAGVSNV